MVKEQLCVFQQNSAPAHSDPQSHDKEALTADRYFGLHCSKTRPRGVQASTVWLEVLVSFKGKVTFEAALRFGSNKGKHDENSCRDMSGDVGSGDIRVVRTVYGLG